jgi:hypothetical protein
LASRFFVFYSFNRLKVIYEISLNLTDDKLEQGITAVERHMAAALSTGLGDARKTNVLPVMQGI